MIIIGFIIDYIVMLLLPINTYFIGHEIDKNKIYNVIIVGIILDIIFSKLFINTIILVSIYLVVKYLNIKNKYYYIKNFIIFSLFCLIGGLSIKMYLVSSILEVVYMIIYKYK